MFRVFCSVWPGLRVHLTIEDPFLLVPSISRSQLFYSTLRLSSLVYSTASFMLGRCVYLRARVLIISVDGYLGPGLDLVWFNLGFEVIGIDQIGIVCLLCARVSQHV